MSYLLVDEFNDSTPINTTFRILNNGVKLGYIRAHCFKRGTINGSFTITVLQNDVELGSATIDSSDINNISGTFLNGFFTWVFDEPLHLAVDPELDEQEYQLRFTSSGFTPDANNSFFICKGFDRGLVEDYGDNFKETPNSQKALSAPYGLEFYTWDF